MAAMQVVAKMEINLRIVFRGSVQKLCLVAPRLHLLPTRSCFSQSKKIKQMASLNIQIPHELTQEEALARIKTLLVRIKQEQKDNISDVKEEWEGSTGSFQFRSFGQSLAGVIDVTSSNVEINSKLPLTLSLFKGKIEEVIRNKAAQLLA
jgi:hypothetical protein